MSYVALATDLFDEVVQFYGEYLGFPVVDHWDRENGRGRRFDLDGLRLEILDNARERHPLQLTASANRFHVVVEVDNISAVHARLGAGLLLQTVSWGARIFQIRDPDGVPVTFLEWEKQK
jgi:catechol 2,3-dioxygenase-like lactoylglutathione lyase family enzyme